MLTKDELKGMMPKGFQKQVAEKAGVSQAAVCKYFSGKTRTSEKIETASLEIALKWKKKIAAISNQIKSLVYA